MWPQLRQDAIVGRWVIIAPQRALRPHDRGGAEDGHLQSVGDCPFCPGSEHQTPDELHALRDTASGAWRVRSVTNKFPALAPDTISGTAADTISGTAADPISGTAADVAGTPTGGPLRTMLPGVGRHEVIIDSPRHVRSTSQLSAAETADVLRVYRDRLIALRRDRQIVHASIFKNAGAAAGASLEHIHSQLIATPIRPIWVEEEIAGGRAYHQSQGRCVFCDLLADAESDGERVVCAGPRAVVFCPFASRFSHEMWILPRRHASHFETLTDEELVETADLLRRAIVQLEAAVGPTAYNYILHTAPFDLPAAEHYHWHLEIIPRLSSAAGFEWSTGIFINPTPPELAAEQLRRGER